LSGSNNPPKGRGLLLALLILLIGILLPIAWLSQQWPPARRIFEMLIISEQVHIVMHLLLYTSLSFVLSCLSPLKPGWRKLTLILLLILGVGLLQERIQVWFQGRHLGIGELYDVAIDLSGGLIGSSLELLLDQHRRFN
jgi:hypothetical protein